MRDNTATAHAVFLLIWGFLSIFHRSIGLKFDYICTSWCWYSVFFLLHCIATVLNMNESKKKNCHDCIKTERAKRKRNVNERECDLTNVHKKPAIGWQRGKHLRGLLMSAKYTMSPAILRIYRKYEKKRLTLELIFVSIPNRCSWKKNTNEKRWILKSKIVFFFRFAGMHIFLLCTSLTFRQCNKFNGIAPQKEKVN